MFIHTLCGALTSKNNDCLEYLLQKGIEIDVRYPMCQLLRLAWKSGRDQFAKDCHEVYGLRYADKYLSAALNASSSTGVEYYISKLQQLTSNIELPLICPEFDVEANSQVTDLNLLRRIVDCGLLGTKEVTHSLYHSL